MHEQDDEPIPGDESSGSLEIRDALTQTIYEQMRPIAASLLGNPAGKTLQPTAVVNEAFVRLANNSELQLHSREHLVSLAARAMRFLIADHARQRLSARRGGGMARVSLSEIGTDNTARDYDVLDVHNALSRLERFSTRQSQIVELRFFGGLSVPEIATAIGVSERTVRDDWRFAKAWLGRELNACDTT